MQLRSIKAGVLAMPLSAMALSGCAMAGKPLTPGQRIAGCVGAVVGGTILGAIIGGAVGKKGDGSAGRGAAIGAAAGTGLCAVWLAFNNERDKRLIAEAQLRAAESGQPVRRSWTGDDGRMRSVSVVPSTETQMMVPRKSAKEAPRVCRPMSTTPSLAGQSAEALPVVYCRDANGDYAPATSEMVPIQ